LIKKMKSDIRLVLQPHTHAILRLPQQPASGYRRAGKKNLRIDEPDGSRRTGWDRLAEFKANHSAIPRDAKCGYEFGRAMNANQMGRINNSESFQRGSVFSRGRVYDPVL